MTESEKTPETREIRRAGLILAAGTMASRILGLVRNQLMSHYFGAGAVSDAFIAAFTIPNALRRLFGEGGLTPSFVSLFTRALKEDKKTWQNFISASFIWLSLTLLSLTALAMLFAPELVSLYVPHFQDDAPKFELTVRLTQFLFPFILIMSWIALFMGILNSFGRFFIPAIGPAMLNLIVITLTPLLLWHYQVEAAQGVFIFGGCILLGVIVQAALMLPSLIKLKALPKIPVQLLDPRVGQLALMLGPALFSLAIHQLNIIVNRVFASAIPDAVSHLFFADLLIELPVSLIATSMSVAAVPSFTRLYINGDQKKLGEAFHYSFSLNVSLAFPCMVGLIVLAYPIVSSLFQSGEFSLEDSLRTTDALVAYAAGLVFFCLIRSLIPLYFAAKDTLRPALFGLAALLINFIAAWQLSRLFSTPGIALATSIASFTNFSLLLAFAMIQFRQFPWRACLKEFVKSCLAALCMGLVLFAALKVVDPSIWKIQGLSLIKAGYLGGLILTGALAYYAAARAFKLQAFLELIHKAKLLSSKKAP